MTAQERKYYGAGRARILGKEYRYIGREKGERVYLGVEVLLPYGWDPHTSLPRLAVPEPVVAGAYVASSASQNKQDSNDSLPRAAAAGARTIPMLRTMKTWKHGESHSLYIPPPLCRD